jgi:hypothetical protein
VREFLILKAEDSFETPVVNDVAENWNEEQSKVLREVQNFEFGGRSRQGLDDPEGAGIGEFVILEAQFRQGRGVVDELSEEFRLGISELSFLEVQISQIGKLLQLEYSRKSNEE